MSTTENPINKAKKKLNMVEKVIVENFLSIILKKGVPAIKNDAENIYKTNKTIVMSIQKNGDSYVPMIIIYESDKVWKHDSPLNASSNMAKDEKTGKPILIPIDDIDKVSELISKLM